LGVIVDAEAFLTVTDRRGERVVRVYDKEEKALQEVVLPSLVREVSLKVDYRVRLADGTDQGIIEVRCSYSSLDDPDVRGPLGLERGDDPARVPAPSVILRQLARQSAEQFAGLLKPVVMEAAVPLQPAAGAEAGEGFRAVKRGELAAAAEHFETALSARPGNANLQFNLAVVAEALGRFRQAEGLYGAVAGNEGVKRSLRDAAGEGQRRVGRMLLVTAPPREPG